ncbi:MAG: ImmA/IrrE family metallo-endopeptidase [Solirubrobacteraceae bacterium]
MAATDSASTDIREALREVAQEISGARGREGPPARRWAGAGIEVRAVRMRGHGRCDVSDRATPLVQVNAADNAYTQHFTIAHEVGHLLLGSLPVEQLREISHRDEEDICDEFAQRVIVPPDELADALAGDGAPGPRKVLQLCGAFEANPSTVLRALGDQLHLDRTAYLLARLRTHYLRPEVMGFRIDAASGPGALFWPYETRIENVGLRTLAADGTAAEHGAFIEGEEERLAVPLSKVDAATGDNAAIGPAHWQAARQGRVEPYLLVRIDCSQLRRSRLKPDTPDRTADEPKTGAALAAKA